MPVPNYPDTLKIDWDAKKGTLAKAAGETGVGAAMKHLRTTFDQTEWLKLSAATTYGSEAEIDQAIKDCKAAFAKIEPIKAAAYKLRDAAKAAATKFKANKLIPKASAELALSISTAADHFGVALKSYDPMPDFEEARKRVQAKLKIGRDQLKGLIAKVEAGAASLDHDKVTATEWATFWKGPLRGVQAAIAVVPELKTQFSPIFVKLCSQEFVGANDLPPAEIRKKIAVVRQAAAKLKAVAG